MRVTFYKVDEGRLCSWTATTPKGKPFQGTTMASGSKHAQRGRLTSRQRAATTRQR